MDITYTEKDGLLYPDLTLKDESGMPIGKYALRYLQKMKELELGKYNKLLMTGQLTAHLSEYDQLMHLLVEQFEVQLRESQKAEMPDRQSDMLGWVGWMNNIKHQAEELAEAQMTS